jgi:peptidoglycan hydrolase-like protein with peptidoglycan-binding domain
MSKRINGGTIGLEDRINRYNSAKVILGGYSPSAVAPKPTKPAVRTLRRGMSGPDVAKIQAVVGVAVDGVFGFDTASAVKKWQRANGLVADGIVGPATQEKMFKK